MLVNRPDEQMRRCSGPKGVRGKEEVTADLQDVLLHQLEGIGQYGKRLGALRRPDREADSFVLSALFTTMINVNFDDARLPPARSRTCWTDPLRSYESNISHPMVILYA